MTPRRTRPAVLLLAASPQAKVRIVLALLDRMAFQSTLDNPYHTSPISICRFFRPCCGARLPFSEQDLRYIVDGLKEQRQVLYLESTLRPIVTQIERHASCAGLSEDLHRGLDDLKKKHLATPDYADLRKLAKRIGLLLGDVRKNVIEQGEPWTDMMLADLAAMDEANAAAWQRLIEHAFAIKSSEASGKWMEEARGRLEAAGAETFKERVTGWFATAEKGTGEPMTEAKADLLKGLIWYCAAASDASSCQAICDVALAVFKKIPGIGPRSVKVGNACIYVLSRLPGLEPVAQLSRLQLKVKYSKVHSLINTALEEAAARAGMTRADLEEISVPTFGLEGQGILHEDLGEHAAEIRVTGTADAELIWIKKDGKTQKSVPAAVREEFGEELASLKRTVKDIENMLPAQRDRIERLFLSQRSLPYTLWRERYLDHPLLAQLSRRLIWHFERQGRSGLAALREDRLVDAQDRTVEWKGGDTVVRLWHPVGFDISTVQGWRLWLERHGISQPFKQAHRELYLLTDAELATGTYSNRFAAHILKQHQFSALCKQRGWKYQLQGAWDSANTPVIELPQWELRAEFWWSPCLPMISRRKPVFISMSRPTRCVLRTCRASSFRCPMFPRSLLPRSCAMWTSSSASAASGTTRAGRTRARPGWGMIIGSAIPSAISRRRQRPGRT